MGYGVMVDYFCTCTTMENLYFYNILLFKQVFFPISHFAYNFYQTGCLPIRLRKGAMVGQS